MSGWLFENPWPLCAIGAITAVLLAAGAVKTGKIALMYASGGILVLAAGLFWLERQVVTPGEEVASTLSALAADLESNDLDRVLEHISSSAEDLRTQVRSVLPRLIIHRATVKPNLQVELLGGNPPTAAKASFNGVIVASDRRGSMQNQHGAWFFEVHFRVEDDRWRLWRYERDDPRQGLR